MKFKPQQILTAAVPVVVGLALFNIAKKLAGNTPVGKVLDGSIVR